jgi:hypothetical protein
MGSTDEVTAQYTIVNNVYNFVIYLPTYFYNLFETCKTDMATK